MYKNTEISSMIIALGLGMKGEESTTLRYGKVTPCSRMYKPEDLQSQDTGWKALTLFDFCLVIAEQTVCQKVRTTRVCT